MQSIELHFVGELSLKDYFRQRVVTVETTSGFLSGLGELEDHDEGSIIEERSLGTHGAFGWVIHGRGMRIGVMVDGFARERLGRDSIRRRRLCDCQGCDPTKVLEAAEGCFASIHYRWR